MSNPRIPVIGIRLTLVALVLAVYWSAIGFDYVHYDDTLYVTENSWVQTGLTPAGVIWACTTGDAANWHPMTWLSLMLDTTLFGNTAWGHHAMSIALHTLNVLLLLSALQMMTGALWRSALVAALLAVHPIHVESVAWISERKDVLSMLFWLLTMRTYAAYARSPDVGRYLMVIVLMALGLMSKPMVVTLPLVLLLLDCWPLKRVVYPPRTSATVGLLALEKVPLLCISAALSAFTVMVQHGSGDLSKGYWIPMAQRIENAVIAYTMYLGKLVWPLELAALYPNVGHLGQQVWPHGHVALAALLLLSISTLAIALLRRAPYVAVGWLWFLGTMVPVVGVVQVGWQLIADRYAYIPFVGLYVALVWSAWAVLARFGRGGRAVGATIAAGIVLMLSILALRQVWVWRDDLALFGQAVRVTPNNWVMMDNLAHALERDGRRDDALEQMRAARDICTSCAWLDNHYGAMLGRAERLYEAQQVLERAMALDPTDWSIHTNLGIVLMQRGQDERGLDQLQAAVDFAPENGHLRVNLATGLHRMGRHDEAIAQVREAIRLQPEMAGQWEPMLRDQ